MIRKIPPYKLTILFLLLANSILAQNHVFDWANQALGDGSSNRSYSIAIDDLGNSYITGYFGGKVDFDPGPGTSYLNSNGSSDIFIQKLDSAGNFMWAKQIGGTSADHGGSIKIDIFGNVIVTGFFNDTADFDPGTGTTNLISVGRSDIFILKLASNGNFLWAKQIEGGNAGIGQNVNIGRDIVPDKFGNIYTIGGFEGVADFDPDTGSYSLNSGNGRDAFILKLDSNGKFIWAKQIRATTNCRGWSINIDPLGDIYAIGNFQDTADFNPGMGINNLISTGSDDGFVLKLDSNGTFIWAKQFGGSSYDIVSEIVIDSSGHVYTAGIFSDTVDFDPGTGINNLISNGNSDGFLLKLNSSGNFLWVKQIGGSSSDNITSIALDSDRNIYNVGIFKGTIDLNPGQGTANFTPNGFQDFFIQKLDSNGNYIWAKTIGGNDQETAASVVLDAMNNILITGFFRGTVDFNPGVGTFNLISRNIDIFVLKLFSATTVGTIKNDIEIAINIYPNPSSGVINLEFKRLNEPVELIVTDILGKPILNRKIIDPNIATLNLNKPPGLYFLIIKSRNILKSFKVIIE